MKKQILATILAALSVLAVQGSASVVVTPNANTNVEGNDSTVSPFRFADFAMQWILDDSLFSSVPVGSRVTAIGFRLDGTQTSQPATDVTYNRWDLQLSNSSKGPGTLSSTFANNVGSNAVNVRSGPLTIPANAFVDVPGVNPFYYISFSTPYIYSGGDLLVTLRLTGNQNIRVDAVTPTSIAGIGNTVGTFDSDANAQTGGVGFFNMPVTAFQFEAAQVPEPSTFVLLGLGFGALVFRRIQNR
jgi:hypothetical protein